MFSKFPAVCDLRNGQVCICGGVDLRDEDAFVNAAVLLDTRDYSVEQIERMAVARVKHQAVESQGSVFVMGGLHSRGKMPVKIVEAYDLKVSSQWRRCASMTLERSEFCAVSSAESHFVYVFGGTLKPEEKYVIERYDVKEDAWEVMRVSLSEEIPFSDIFNVFCLMLVPRAPSNILRVNQSKGQNSLEMTREQMLIQQMLQ